MSTQSNMLEDLLHAWMSMAVYIRSNRILSDLSVNEMLICNTLYQRRQTGGPPVTATELCAQTRLLKSQMNHILTTMEEQGLIFRERSNTDRRTVFVRMREEAVSRYMKEHEHVLKVVEAVRAALGNENTKTLAALMRKAAVAVENNTSSQNKEDV